MKSKEQLFFCMLVLLPLTVSADLKLKPIHPAEPVEYTLKQRFSLENALANMKAIKGYLESFRRLTAAAKGKISAQTLKIVGHTDWETQQLAFSNLPPAVEGALRYQNWLLKKTLHHLAVMESKTRKTSAQKTYQARQEMDRAEKEFQIFWDSLAVAD